MKRHTAPRGKAVKKKGRRNTPAPRGSTLATTDWRAIEAATSAWDGLRFTEEDLDRVDAFLHTPRAARLHGELVAFQARLLKGLQGFDWTAMDAPTLVGLVAIATYLNETRDHGFPPETADRPVERWLTMLYRLILAAEDAGRESLTHARPAMTAVLSSYNGAKAELADRIDRHFGAAAVGVLLYPRVSGDDGDPLAHRAQQRLRQAASKQLPETLRAQARDEIPNVPCGRPRALVADPGAPAGERLGSCRSS